MGSKPTRVGAKGAPIFAETRCPLPMVQRDGRFASAMGQNLSLQLDFHGALSNAFGGAFFCDFRSCRLDALSGNRCGNHSHAHM